MESRQAYDEAASLYRQDPARLIGASDTQAGRERNTKMAAACSVCLHAAMSDVSTSDVKDILNKTSRVFFFFPHLCLFSPFFCHRKSNWSFCSLSMSLCVDILSCFSLLLHRLLLLCPSVFNKDPSDLMKQKLPWSCLTSPLRCQ